MLDGFSNGQRFFNGLRHCAKWSAQRGFKDLYSGFGVALFRILPEAFLFAITYNSLKSKLAFG